MGSTRTALTIARSGIDDRVRRRGASCWRAAVWTHRPGGRGSDPLVQVASTLLKKSRRARAAWSGASKAA
jgi:hypothetical protein